MDPKVDWEKLRKVTYNATLKEIREVTADLRIIRIQPDDGSPEFEPGQFTMLGLMDGEPGVVECLRGERPGQLLRRAYSIGHPMVDENGELLGTFPDYLEFYVVLVREGSKGKPPVFTPRLFALKPGDRLFVGKVSGHYQLREEEIAAKRHLIFCSTGTGEAPHNAMLWSLLRRGYQGRLTAVVCVRKQEDLAYEATFRKLEAKFPNLTYLTLTTREPGRPKKYIQDLIETGEIEKVLNESLSPDRHSFYLCGNPAMIGIPKRSPSDGSLEYPPGKPGVIEVLSRRGFRPDFGREPGQIHFEKYW